MFGESMKKLKIILPITFAIILIVAVCFICGIHFPNNKKDKMQSFLQNIDYSENSSLLYNPDNGFYKAEVFKLKPDGITYSSDKDFSQYNFLKYENQIYHLRLDISAFSMANNGEEDLELTEKVLNDLDSLLNNVKSAQKNAVVRFCYDEHFSGNKDKEPSLEMMIKHIKQLSSILNKYQSTITAIEAGMIGRWGEMNGSAITKDPDIVNAILDAWLDNTNNFAILTRQPQHIYDYLGIDYEDIDNYVISPSDKAYRLGIFDDSYLGSESDCGTFNHDRNKEIDWIAQQTNHLPFGGEATYQDLSDTLFHLEDGCLENMKKLHLSYLNYHYNEDVTSYWKETIYSSEYGDDSLYYGESVYDYIAKHMGYRYVLNKSVFEYNKTVTNFKATLSLTNKGFGSLTKEKDLQLIITDEENNVVERKNVGKFKENIEFSTNLSLQTGNYKVYLAVCSLENDLPTYSIAFANNLFNADLQANLIGKIEIK